MRVLGNCRCPQALHDLILHKLSQIGVIQATEMFFQGGEWDDGFGHRAMAPGTAILFERMLHQGARTFDMRVAAQ